MEDLCLIFQSLLIDKGGKMLGLYGEIIARVIFLACILRPANVLESSLKQGPGFLPFS